jgi:hypothetical protein
LYGIGKNYSSIALQDVFRTLPFLRNRMCPYPRTV